MGGVGLRVVEPKELYGGKVLHFYFDLLRFGHTVLLGAASKLGPRAAPRFSIHIQKVFHLQGLVELDSKRKSKLSLRAKPFLVGAGVDLAWELWPLMSLGSTISRYTKRQSVGMPQKLLGHHNKNFWGHPPKDLLMDWLS